MIDERRDMIRKNAGEIVEKLTPANVDLGDEDGDMTVVGVYAGTKDEETNEEERREGELFARGFVMMVEEYRRWRQEHGPDDHALFTLRRGEADQLTVEVQETNEGTKDEA